MKTERNCGDAERQPVSGSFHCRLSAGIAVRECGTQREIQGRGPRLQGRMSPRRPHHGRLGNGRADPLTGLVALAIVDQSGLIAGDVD